jgi:RNA polymerase sigma factor (sigma-70 family)
VGCDEQATESGPIMAIPAPTSFEDFYRSRLDWARRLAFVLTRDDRCCDDIAQDAFVGLQSRFDDLENPSAYLRVTIVNACRRHLRRESRRQDSYRQLASMPSGLSTSAQEILDLVDRLPARQRAVLVLRYFEGLSEDEIARTLGCRPGTVKSLAARALQRLREETNQ